MSLQTRLAAAFAAVGADVKALFARPRPAPVVDDAGTAYTVVAADEGVYRRLTGTAAKAITVPEESGPGLPQDGEWHFVNVGAGDATFAATGDMALEPLPGRTLVLPPGGVATLKREAANLCRLIGSTNAA